MSSATIWRRRVILMAVVGILVAIPVTLLLRDGNDGSTTSARTAGSPAPELGSGKRDRGLDVTYRLPDGWSEDKKASAIRLTSDSGAVEIVVAAPAAASAASGVLDDALAAIRDGYDEVEISRGSGKKVGGLEARGAVVRAGTPEGSLRILVAVAEGKERAYLVEVFTATDVNADDLRSAQAALNSLQLNG
jgi:hypothetical protein